MPKQKKPQLVMHPGYATGDQFGIAAKLLNEPDTKVVVSRTTPAADQARDENDLSQSILDFYEECGLKDRVKTVQLPQGKSIYDKNKLKQQASRQHGKTHQCVNLGTGTQFVASKWSQDVQRQVRQAWSLQGPDPKVQAWLSAKGLDDESVTGKKVAVIWSRFSGKKGGAHPEHDTSQEGMKQMVAALQNTFDTIVIVGDRHPKHSIQKDQPWVPGPWAGLQGLHPDSKAKIVDLTEFWKGNAHDKAALAEWGGNKRTGQFKLYDHLNAQSQGLVHLGFRSGNLEAMALMGHKVGYMEQKHSMGGPRMDAWQRAKSQGLNYDKILLDQVPTRTGRHLIAEGVSSHAKADTSDDQEKSARAGRQVNAYAQHGLDNPASLPGSHNHKATKQQAGVENFQKGFTDTDISSITSFANASILETAMEKLAAAHNVPDRVPGETAPERLNRLQTTLLERLQTLPEVTQADKLHKIAEMTKLEELQTGLMEQMEMQCSNVDVQSEAVEKLKQSPLLVHTAAVADTLKKLAACKDTTQKINADIWRREGERSKLEREIAKKPPPVKLQENRDQLADVNARLDELARQASAQRDQKAELQTELRSRQEELTRQRQTLLGNLEGDDRELARSLPSALEVGDLDWAKEAREEQKTVLQAKMAALQEVRRQTQDLKAGVQQRLPPQAPLPPQSVANAAHLAKVEVKPLAEQLKEMRQKFKQAAREKAQGAQVS